MSGLKSPKMMSKEQVVGYMILACKDAGLSQNGFEKVYKLFLEQEEKISLKDAGVIGGNEGMRV